MMWCGMIVVAPGCVFVDWIVCGGSCCCACTPGCTSHLHWAHRWTDDRRARQRRRTWSVCSCPSCRCVALGLAVRRVPADMLTARARAFGMRTAITWMSVR